MTQATLSKTLRQNVLLIEQNQESGPATGFLLKYKKEIYLTTAWHVVKGVKEEPSIEPPMYYMENPRMAQVTSIKFATDLIDAYLHHKDLLDRPPPLMAIPS